jgi:octaprenyl-diphosphate synthase
MKGLELSAWPVQAGLDAAARRLRSLLEDLADASPLGELQARYLQPAVGHLFRRQGKLLRPLLVLLSARAGAPETRRNGHGRPRGDEVALVHAAAAVELIHTASLAHDDIIDDSRERRGEDSLHVAHGSTTAILVGDLFYARFFQELAGLPGVDAAARLRLLGVFLGVTRHMCEAEILADQMKLDGAVPALPAYLHIAQAKTAELLSACCLAGGLLSGAPEGGISALAAFGRSMGLLFQIADDLADGDAACTDAAALGTCAEDSRRAAAAAMDCLPDSDAAAVLRSLPDRILSPSPR